MKSRFNSGLQDDTNDGFVTSGDEIFAKFAPWNSYSTSGSATSSSSSQNGVSGVVQTISGSTVAVTSGGITFNLLFDQAAMNAPTSFRTGIEQAASLLSASISDKITVNLKIDYSGTGGGAAAGPDSGFFESYSSIRSDLINHATPGDTVFNALPNASSIQGQSNIAVWNAQLKLFGLLGANDTTSDDGSATFATDINPNLLVGVALHELTHALGRVPYGSQPDIFDLFRFTSPGARLFAGGATAPAAYFSVDGGNTKLANFGQTSDASDFLNSGVQGFNDPFNEFYSGSTTQSLSSVDLKLLDALGFHTSSSSTPLPKSIAVTAAASPAIQGGASVALLSAPPKITDSASTLSGATIKITNASGSAVTGDELFINGQQSGTVDGGLVTVNWNNTTKVLTLTGNASVATYQTLLSEITYQDSGTDSSTGSHPQHTVNWTVNDGTANLSTTSHIAIERAPTETAANLVFTTNAPVAASSLVKASDPDGDTIAKYAFMDTGNGHFALNGVVQAHNQEIDVTAAQLSGLTFQSDGGTDSLHVRVNDGTLWSAWQSFTVTGPTPPPAHTVVESFGFTSLVKVGNNYFLDNSTGSGPELKFSGAAVVAGQFSGLTPIAAEQVTGGYDVAWKNVSTNQYTVWHTDTNGNFLSNLATNVSGTSSTLESLEPIFHQDLNGDGKVGVPLQVAHTAPAAAVSPTQDSFVFAPNFGQVTLNHFDPVTDSIQFSQSVFANLAALAAATHDDTHGNAVITDAAHDTLTISHVTAAQLLAHQNDFHFV